MNEEDENGARKTPTCFPLMGGCGFLNSVLLSYFEQPSPRILNNHHNGDIYEGGDDGDDGDDDDYLHGRWTVFPTLVVRLPTD